MAAAPPVFYLIPGLGADERVFQGLQLVGEVHVLRWLPVLSPTETLALYAARLAAAIPDAQACWLVGVSFGGVLALEVAKLRPLTRVALISSLATADELPWLARVARVTGLHRLLPAQGLQLMPRVAQWFFNVANGAEFKLLRQIIRDTDPAFARWAIAQLVHWPSRTSPPAVRIHGTHDRLLPAGAAKSQYLLPGGHFIIFSQAVKISHILNQLAATASATVPAQSTIH
jgi:pimeloyl-ACP methyl ester carboxylesterase